MADSVYLYLTNEDWVGTWVDGGKAPLWLASRYLCTERSGTSTPDETVVHETNFPTEVAREIYAPIWSTFGGMPEAFRHFSIVNCEIDGVQMPNFAGSYFHEDGLVLCLSTSLRGRIMRHLHKRSCVRLLDVNALKRDLDRQIGVESEMRECEYTRSHVRNAFLKSIEDEWMHEFRLYWRGALPQEVTIPRGAAERVFP